MVHVELKLSVKFKWWWKPYIIGVVLFAKATGMRPDPVKIRHYSQKAMKFYANGRRVDIRMHGGGS